MAELRAKLLHHLARKTENHGFTLIELLVVIIIIGILSAIALPSFLRYANRARESEAKTYVGTINIAQQAYLIEHDQFTTLENLGLAIPSNTAYYVYDSVMVGSGLNEVANTTATPIFDTARGYAGKVWTAPGLDGNTTSWAIVCEGDMGTVPVIAATTCPP